MQWLRVLLSSAALALAAHAQTQAGGSEIPQGPGGATVSLKEWTGLRVELAEARAQIETTRIDARILASEKAIEIADAVLTIRLDHANNTLAKMAEAAATYMRRTEAEVLVNNLSDRVASLEQHRSGVEGRSSGRQPLIDIAMLIGAGVIALVATRFGSKKEQAK